LEDFGVDGRIILKCIFSSDGKDVDWINMAQDRKIAGCSGNELWG
jgi:hypothetical protein